MERKLKIGFDFDGPISDVWLLKKKCYEKLFNLDISLSEVNISKQVFINQGLISREQANIFVGYIYENAESSVYMFPTEGIYPLLAELQEAGHLSKIITRRHSYDSLLIARHWLKSHEIDLKVVSNGGRTDKNRELVGVDIFIDDDINILTQLAKENVVPNLFWLNPYDEPGDLMGFKQIKIVKSLVEFGKEIKKIANNGNSPRL